MAKNGNLNKAKEVKFDEFYTRISDIENELKHYKKHFKNKIVFCNCDDPETSNFWRYFNLNFDFLELKKLISTHYDKGKTSHALMMWRDDAGVHSTIQTLKEDGDFRSEECIEFLKESDIVVTNPPFSLFREYIAQLMKYEKKFIIIGPKGAIAYKDFFPLLKDNKIWIGYTMAKEFDKPDGTTQKFGNIGWYTNLDISKRHEDLVLYKKYKKKDYPKYDNYDAIEVSKVGDIPIDYYETMGVPITFMDKYNPDQFEIIGSSIIDCRPIKECIPSNHTYDKGGLTCYLTVDKTHHKRLYGRIFIKRKENK